MPSIPRKAPTRLWPVLPALLACALCACAPRIAINRAALPCSALVQGPLASDVPGAPLPGDTAAVGGWIAFADAQTGQLDKANAYRRAGLDIVRACEARARDVDAQLTKRRRFLGLF